MPRPRKYPDELIVRGVRLALESGRPIAQVAADLGLGAETLRRRVRQAQADSGARGDLLSTAEREVVLGHLHSPRFVDAAPAQVYAALLDEGVYLASERTMYRLLDAAGEIRERRNHLRRPSYARPELLASKPNELWS